MALIPESRLRRRRLCASGLLAICAVASSALSPAKAFVFPSTAEAYFTPGDSLPGLANHYLLGHRGDAIAIMTINLRGNGTRQIYYALGPVAQSAAGVCRFSVTQVFPHRAGPGDISWDNIPPANEFVQPPFAAALQAAEPCPRQNDPSYIGLDADISDEEFAGVIDFWDEVTSSDQKFEDSAAYLPLILSSRLGALFEAFRSRALHPEGEPLQLSAVTRRGGGGYDLGFSNATTEPASFFLSISDGVTGIKMLNFQTYRR